MIAAATPAAATRALRDAWQQAVSCVSTGVLAGQRYALENELTLLGQTVPYPGGGQQFGVRPRRTDWTAVLERARHALDAFSPRPFPSA